MTSRGKNLPRPNPWNVRAADRPAYAGRQQLLKQVPENLDRAWVAITAEPRHIDQRQHPLKGALDSDKLAGALLSSGSTR